MMRCFFAMLLILAGFVNAATWYVDYVDGDDGTGDGSTETPWKTINAAMAQAGVGSGDTIVLKYSATGYPAVITIAAATCADKNLTIQGETGQAGITTVKPASGTFVVTDVADANTGTITFCDIHFDASASTKPCVYSTKTKSLTFIDCTFTDPATTNTRIVNAGNTDSPTRVLRFFDCTFVPTGALADNIVSSSGDIIIDGCTMTASGGRNFVRADYISNMFSVTNNRIIITDSYSNAIRAGVEYVYDDTWDADLDKWEDIAFSLDSLASNDGVMYRCIQDPNGVGAAVTEPGTGTAWKQYWEVYQSEAKVTITGNHLVITDETPAHAVFCGPEIYGATISDNYVTGGNYQIVNKGRMGAIRNNIAIGPNPCYLVGGNNMLVEGNTFVGVGTAALLIGYQFAGLHSSQNRIVNNVLYSTAAQAIKWYADIDITDYVDYNCYYRSDVPTSTLYIYGATTKTYAAMAAIWPTKSTLFGTVNDTHSLNINPLLDSNYKAASPQLVGAGTPQTYRTDGTVASSNSIGATPATGTAENVLFGGRLWN